MGYYKNPAPDNTRVPIHIQKFKSFEIPFIELNARNHSFSFVGDEIEYRRHFFIGKYNLKLAVVYDYKGWGNNFVKWFTLSISYDSTGLVIRDIKNADVKGKTVTSL